MADGIFYVVDSHFSDVAQVREAVAEWVFHMAAW